MPLNKIQGLPRCPSQRCLCRSKDDELGTSIWLNFTKTDLSILSGKQQTCESDYIKIQNFCMAQKKKNKKHLPEAKLKHQQSNGKEKLLDKWVLKQWWHCPQKRLPTAGHIFSCHKPIHGRSGECYLNLVSSDQDAAKQSTGHKTAPETKNYPASVGKCWGWEAIF